MEISPHNESEKLPIFNSPLEIGIRVIIIIDEFYLRKLDLSELCLFDYFLLHSSDASGPISVLPIIPSRYGEYFIRRAGIEEGLKLMRRSHMVHFLSETSGVTFKTSDRASAFIDTMDSPYNTKLRSRAEWLSHQVSSDPSFKGKLLSLINQWEFNLLKGI